MPMVVYFDDERKFTSTGNKIHIPITEVIVYYAAEDLYHDKKI